MAEPCRVAAAADGTWPGTTPVTGNGNTRMRPSVAQIDAFDRRVARRASSSAAEARHGCVEAGVEQRVHGAIDQRQRLGEDVHRFRYVVAVLRPDVDQVHGEVRRPAGDERAHNAQGHLDGAHACARHRRHVERRPTQTRWRGRRSTSV